MLIRSSVSSISSVPRARLALALLAATLAAACGDSSTLPRWTDVVATHGEVAQHLESRAQRLSDGKSVRVVGTGADVHLELTLEAADWKRQELPGFWLSQPALILTGGGGAQTNSSGFRLAAGARVFEPAPSWELDKGFPPDHFYVGPEGVVLRLPKRETPAAQTTLSVRMHGGGDGTGRVFGRRFSGRGFQVWPGQSLSVSVDVPAHSVLRFATTLEPLLAASPR